MNRPHSWLFILSQPPLEAVISSAFVRDLQFSSRRWEIPVQPLQSGAAQGECVCNIWFPAQDVKSQQGGHLLPIREIKQDRGQGATPISTRGHWTAAAAAGRRQGGGPGPSSSSSARGQNWTAQRDWANTESAEKENTLRPRGNLYLNVSAVTDRSGGRRIQSHRKNPWWIITTDALTSKYHFNVVTVEVFI